MTGVSQGLTNQVSEVVSEVCLQTMCGIINRRIKTQNSDKISWDPGRDEYLIMCLNRWGLLPSLLHNKDFWEKSHL